MFFLFELLSDSEHVLREAIYQFMPMDGWMD